MKKSLHAGVAFGVPCVVLLGACRGMADGDAQAVVVVANRNVPEAAETAIRVGARRIRILRRTGEKEKADRVEAGLRDRWEGRVVLSWLDTAKP